MFNHNEKISDLLSRLSCFIFRFSLLFLIAQEGDPRLSTLLLGGMTTREGDVMAMNSHLEFGPVCDHTFGYNEVMHQIQNHAPPFPLIST